MKICLVPDLHLFSSEIGGNWTEDSFLIFKQRLLPKIKETDPEMIVFLGDILDPHSGRMDPRWSKGDEASARFVEALKQYQIKNAYTLQGNHDFKEPLKNIKEMGGPQFIDNNWIYIKDTAIYFFSSRYPNIPKAEEDLKRLSLPSIKNKILLLHENLSIPGAENIHQDIIKELSLKFEAIFNAHQHIFYKPLPNVWCLPSTLPWRCRQESAHLEITWTTHSPQINQKKNPFGFWLFEPEKKELKFVSVDLGIKIAMIRLYFSNASSNIVRQRLIETSEMLSKNLPPPNTIVRVYLEGTLKKGEERIDIDFSEIETRYYTHFYEGKTKNIIKVDKLKGGGSYFSSEDLRYLSIGEALKQLEPEIPQIRAFYEEISDLIEKKHYDPDILIDRIKDSKIIP